MGWTWLGPALQVQCDNLCQTSTPVLGVSREQRAAEVPLTGGDTA